MTEQGDTVASRQIRTHSKLTPKLIQQVCNLIEKGNYPQVAAATCGIPNATWNDWLKMGKATCPDEWPARINGERIGDLCRTLSDSVEVSIAKAESKAVATMRKGDPLPRGGRNEAENAKWWLARARRHNYGEQQRLVIEVQAQHDRFLDFLESRLDAVTYVRLLTDWQEERIRLTSGIEAPEVSEATSSQLLRAANVVDTEGVPALPGAPSPQTAD